MKVFKKFIEDKVVILTFGVIGLLGLVLLPFKPTWGLSFISVFLLWYISIIVVKELEFRELLHKTGCKPRHLFKKTIKLKNTYK